MFAIRTALISFCFVVSAVFGPLVVGAAEQTAEKTVVKYKAGEEVAEATVPYYLFLGPAAQATDKTAKFPLLLFLHGAGERGDDLAVVKKHGPPKIVEGKPDFPFIVVSPQCPTGQRWNPEQLVDLVDQVAKKYPVDTNRIYVTGLSMGGFGTWDLLAKYPGKFAAAVPICGGGNPDTVDAFKKVPLWVFHGAKDTAVSLAKSEAMVDALKKAGATVQFTVYPEAGHDSWTETYNNPELYAWLLKQKLP